MLGIDFPLEEKKKTLENIVFSFFPTLCGAAKQPSDSSGAELLLATQRFVGLQLSSAQLQSRAAASPTGPIESLAGYIYTNTCRLTSSWSLASQRQSGRVSQGV